MVLKPGQKGDFKVMVGNKVILDKKTDESDFAKLNADMQNCPEGKPKPFPKAAAAAKVISAIEKKKLGGLTMSEAVAEAAANNKLPIIIGVVGAVLAIGALALRRK